MTSLIIIFAAITITFIYVILKKGQYDKESKPSEKGGQIDSPSNGTGDSDGGEG